MDAVYDIEFKGHKKIQYVNPSAIAVAVGDTVIVQAERGEHCGVVSRIFDADEIDGETLAIVRQAGPEDLERMIKNQLREKEAYRIGKDKILERDLPMKLSDVEYQFDGGKVSFYFTSEQRIDFRELVRSLASIFHTRIDMRQIGARDEAKRSCSIGSCGRPLCCGSFLPSLKTVTTDSIEHQHLSMSPAKLLGACGRLKCCLLYEKGYYEEAGKRFPKLGAHITTESGPCDVIKIDIIGDAILVR